MMGPGYKPAASGQKVYEQRDLAPLHL